MSKLTRCIVVGLALAGCLGTCVHAANPAILFLRYNPGYDIEPQYRHELQAAGYEIGRCNYADLTWNVLRQYNAIVMDWAPPVSYTGDYNTFVSKLPLINQFLSSGGGVFVLYENGYDQNYQAPNVFLSQYGASIINEGVVDPNHQYKQVGYLGWYWASTANITAHAVTAGVSNIWYPVGSSPTADRMTATLSLDANWQTPVRGESTAYSYNNTTGNKTYLSSPPIVAARTAGTGRIVAFPSYSTYTSTNGHHPALQDITWTRGDGITPSGVYQMFKNVYDWLSAPSLNGGVLGGYVAPADPIDPPLTCPGIWTGGKVYGSPYKVLVGAHSSYSDGAGTVAEWTTAAKAKGYSLLIFAENLANMTEAKWNQQQADCAAVSDSTFKAIAGIDYRDTQQSSTSDGGRRITFDLQRWFDPTWLSPDGTRVTQNSGVLFGNNWPGMVLTNAKTNPLPPWYDKFYRQFSIYTYDHNTLADSEFDEYLQLARDGYGQHPYVVRRLYAPSEVAAVSGTDLYTVATSVGNAYANIKPGGWNWSTYVSEGPSIVDWYIDNDSQAPTDCGGVAGNQWTLHINASAPAGLSEVIVYDGPLIFRRFKPSGTLFATTVAGLHDKQHSFVLVIRDSAGKQAIGAALDTNSREHAIYMCADMQNTLNSANVPNAANTKMVNYGVMGAYVTGWDNGTPGVLADNIVPLGFDNATGGFNFGTSHYLSVNSEGSLARRVFYHGSRDVCILDNQYKGYLAGAGVYYPDTEYADTVARYTSFTPPLGGINIMRIDLTTTFKKACPLGTSTGLEVSLLRVAMPADSFSNWAYIKSGGSKMTGVRNPSGVSISAAPLQTNGYVAVYPDFYGSCAVFALNRGLLMRLENSTLSVGYKMAGQTVQSGTIWRNSLLLVRDVYGAADLTNFDLIRGYFGAGGTRQFAPAMIRGTLVTGTFYPLELTADSHSAELTTSAAAFPNDLPVMVDGLNGKCDAGLFDMDTQTLKPIGVTDGVGYTRFSTSAARHIWIGNLVVADNPDVWVQLVDMNWQTPRLRLHNPTDSPITTGITGLLPALSQLTGAVTIPAGTTIEVSVDPTPPSVPVVTDDGASTTNHRSLHAAWVSTDPESGIADYSFAVGLTPTDTGSYVVPWASAGTSTQGAATGAFESGRTYYFYVKATNGGGMVSEGISDGITVQSSILAAQSQPDTTTVTLSNVVITAAFPLVQRYYVEEYDRAAALALISSGTYGQGDEVNVTGQIRTVSGERVIFNGTISRLSTANALPRPYGLNNRDLGGAGAGYQPGVDGGVGPGNLAFLVRTWGKVVDAGSGYFRIDDGSGVAAAGGIAGVKVIHGFGNPGPGFVCVTGVSCVDKVSGVSYRAIRTRSADDVQVIPLAP